jgi:hypothetical protein
VVEIEHMLDRPRRDHPWHSASGSVIISGAIEAMISDDQCRDRDESGAGSQRRHGA